VAAAYSSGSDEGLKDNIVFIGWFMGQKIYRWTWNAVAIAFGITAPTIGVIAQQTRQDCVSRHPDGYLMVNYRKLFGGQS
jgi:hypothetical protein